MQCHKKADLVKATSRDMRRAARYLESKVGTIGPGEFTELQQALGITHHQHALLLDRSLDETDTSMTSVGALDG